MDRVGPVLAGVATIWRLSHPEQLEARGVLVPHGTQTTFTWWLGEHLKVSAEFAQRAQAERAGEVIRQRLLSRGYCASA